MSISGAIALVLIIAHITAASNQISNVKFGPKDCDAATTMTVQNTCICKDGYEEIPGERYRCRDIDECKEDSHRCDYGGQCVNTVGSFHCTCPNHCEFHWEPSAVGGACRPWVQFSRNTGGKQGLWSNLEQYDSCDKMTCTTHQYKSYSQKCNVRRLESTNGVVQCVTDLIHPGYAPYHFEKQCRALPDYFLYPVVDKRGRKTRCKNANCMVTRFKFQTDNQYGDEIMLEGEQARIKFRFFYSSWPENYCDLETNHTKLWGEKRTPIKRGRTVDVRRKKILCPHLIMYKKGQFIYRPDRVKIWVTGNDKWEFKYVRVVISGVTLQIEGASHTPFSQGSNFGKEYRIKAWNV